MFSFWDANVANNVGYCNTSFKTTFYVDKLEFCHISVCKASYEFLQNNIDQPLLDIEEMYSGLYTKVVELNAVKV